MKNIFQSGNDTAGVISLLVGLIVIVFAALGVSVVLDNDIQVFSAHKSNTKLRGSNDSQQKKIDTLEIRLLAIEKQKQKIAAHTKQLAEVKELQEQNKTAKQEIQILRKMTESAKGSIALLDQSHVSYRTRHRDYVRLQAIGKKMDTVTTRLGKTYKEVVIREISPLGVQISHQYGGALLDYGEMPEAWRTSYKFTALECANARVTEQNRLKKYYAAVAKRSNKINKERSTSDRLREITSLRRKIAAHQNRYHYINTEASLAQRKATAYVNERATRAYSRSYSYRTYNRYTRSYTRSSYRPRYRITLNRNSRTMPGSLTTWQERADQLRRSAASYRSRISSMQAKLMTLDPSYVMPGR